MEQCYGKVLVGDKDFKVLSKEPGATYEQRKKGEKNFSDDDSVLDTACHERPSPGA